MATDRARKYYHIIPMGVVEEKWMIKVENILLVQILLSFNNNLKLGIIRELQTEYWHLEKIFRRYQRLQMLGLEETWE